MNFDKIINFVNFYKNFVDKDPFIALNIHPFNSNIQEYNNNKYAEFIKKQGKEYINSMISCFLSIPIMNTKLLEKNKIGDKEVEEFNRRGFKLAGAKPEISPNIIIKGIFDKYEQDILKASESLELACSYYKEKNYIESQKALEEAFRYDPNNPVIINNLFVVSYLNGNFEKVQELLKIMAILGFKEVDFFTK